jgi:hypothetical protein
VAGILVGVAAILASGLLLIKIVRRRKGAALEESVTGEIEMVEGGGSLGREGVSADGEHYLGGIFSGGNTLGTGDALFDGILNIGPDGMEEGLYA